MKERRKINRRKTVVPLSTLVDPVDRERFPVFAALVDFVDFKYTTTRNKEEEEFYGTVMQVLFSAKGIAQCADATLPESEIRARAEILSYFMKARVLDSGIHLASAIQG